MKKFTLRTKSVLLLLLFLFTGAGTALADDPVYYNITAAAGITGGSISFADTLGNPITRATKGDSVVVNVTHSDQYMLKTLYYLPDDTTQIQLKMSINLDKKSGKYLFVMPGKNITVCAEFQRLYNITAASTITGGSISFANNNGTAITQAVEGVYVVVNVTPNALYKLTGLYYLDANSKATEINKDNDNGGVYAFKMPSSNITVYASFQKVSNDQIIYYTTTDGQPLNLTGTDGLWGKNGPNQIKLVSESYEDGQGILTFSYPLIQISTEEAKSGPFFGKYNLQTITIPSSVTLIGKHAFDGDSLLTTISVHGGAPGDISNITSFDEYAFNKCRMLENITFSPNISKIGIDAFNNCNSLHSDFVFTCDNLVIDEYAFISSGIKSVEFKGQNISVGLEAFEWCTSLESVKTSGNGSVKYIGEKGFYKSSVTSVDLTMTSSIAKQAFFESESLQTLNLRGCTSIGDQAFYESKVLQSVSIDGPTYIGQFAFEQCPILESVTLKDIVAIDKGAFSMNRNITSMEIPGSCDSIGHSAFYGCSGLTSLKLNEGLKSIGAQAFASGLHIENLVIPASVTHIQKDAFQSCDTIKTVFFRLSTQSGIEKFIDDGAFSLCKGLKYVVLPKALKQLGEGIFDGCSALEKVFFINSNCPILDFTFKDIYTSVTPFTGLSKKTDIYVPVGSKNHYKDEFTKAHVINMILNDEKQEIGDVASKKVLGWTLIETNSTGYSSFGGSLSEGGSEIVDHRWDFQSYEGLLDNMAELGLSDIKDLEIYSCIGVFDSTYTVKVDNEDVNKTVKVVRFNRMRVNNNSGGKKIYYLPKKAGSLLYYSTTNNEAKRFGILETPDSVSNADYNDRTYTTKNYMKSGTGVALGKGQYYVFGSKYDSQQQKYVTGFYRLSSTVVVPAGKAYLDLKDFVFTPGGNSNTEVELDFSDDGGDPTGIEIIENDEVVATRPTAMYNLQGQRVTNPRGFYIMNGKKYYAK